MPRNRTKPPCLCGCGLYSRSGIYLEGHRPFEVRFWSKVNKTDSCWLWTGAATAPGRYGRIRVDDKPTLAHHVAWSLAGGTIPEGMQILHTCDTPACVRNDDLGTYAVRDVSYERRGHLFIGTIAVNGADKADKGRVTIAWPNGLPPMPGESNPRAVLTEADVLEIRRLATIPGTTLNHLARLYGVSGNQIGLIVHRKSWRHI